MKVAAQILSPLNLSPNFRKLKEWGFESRMTLFWLFLCCRQKLYLHATKAIALFKDECVSKYDTFLDKAEEGQDVQSSTGNPEISEGSPGTRQPGLSSGSSSCFGSLRTKQVTLDTWAGPSYLNTTSAARAASSQRSQL